MSEEPKKKDESASFDMYHFFSRKDVIFVIVFLVAFLIFAMAVKLAPQVI